MFKHSSLDKVYQYLLIILAFLMPLTVFGANFVIVITCVLWLISGEYKSKIHEIVNNKLLLSSIAFFLMHVIGLFWTENLSWGLHIVHKMWYFFLLFPILYSISKRKYVKHYIFAFLLAIFITEVLSYLVWFEILPEFKNAQTKNPTPFMSHISYNPILAFAIYLVLHQIFFNFKLKRVEIILYSFFSISMTFNMFITGGRAGQVMFFAVLAILIFQYFNKQKFKAIIVIVIVTSSVFFTAYQSSSVFQKRANDVLIGIQKYESDKSTPVGQRLTFAINSWELISENPIIGVGTGDFPDEYAKVNRKNTPSQPNATNPHNMYTLVLSQLGLLGLLSFLLIFYYQIKWSLLSKNRFIKDTGTALPLLFLLIMFSDSYLLGHYTSLLYMFFSSFLYKDFEKS